MLNLIELCSIYENTHEKNKMVFEYLEDVAKSNEMVWNHRMYIEANRLGWGERSFAGMWMLIVDSLKDNFKFLEIGVYKGQILTLIGLLSKLNNKSCTIYGISPLSNVGDKYWIAPDDDYEGEIKNLINKFDLNDREFVFFKGLSTEESIINSAKSIGYFDVVYIDGGHNYDTVVSDIINYKPLVKVNGYLIMDDASCYINADGFNKGLTDVSDAVRDYLDNDENYVNILNVGHNRVYKRKS